MLITTLLFPTTHRDKQGGIKINIMTESRTVAIHQSLPLRLASSPCHILSSFTALLPTLLNLQNSISDIAFEYWNSDQSSKNSVKSSGARNLIKS